MAYAILIESPRARGTAYGPVAKFEVATAVSEKLVAEDEGLTGRVTFLNPVPAALLAAVSA